MLHLELTAVLTMMRLLDK